MPEPDRLVIDAPELVAEISNVALSATLDCAIDPVPDNASVPELIVVPPL